MSYKLELTWEEFRQATIRQLSDLKAESGELIHEDAVYDLVRDTLFEAKKYIEYKYE